MVIFQYLFEKNPFLRFHKMFGFKGLVMWEHSCWRKKNTPLAEFLGLCRYIICYTLWIAPTSCKAWGFGFFFLVEYSQFSLCLQNPFFRFCKMYGFKRLNMWEYSCWTKKNPSNCIILWEKYSSCVISLGENIRMIRWYILWCILYL